MMFKGLQDIFQKEEGHAKMHAPGILPVFVAKELLLDSKRHEIIEKFPEQLSLQPTRYNAIAKVFLESFAEFVQQLPETQNSYFSHLGGLLDHALERSSIALSLVRAYFLPTGSEHERLNEQQALWAYTVFTASMLHDIGKIIDDLHIDITNQHGKKAKEWLPFAGSMIGKGTHYKYEFENVTSDVFRHRATLILAQKLLPDEGFQWIASSKEVLGVWMALLIDDERRAGTLGPALMRADAQAILRYFDQERYLHKHEKSASRRSDAAKTFISASEAAEAFAAIKFLKQLKEKMKAGKLTPNKKESGIYRTKKGMLITEKAIKAIVGEKNVTKVIGALKEGKFITLSADNKSGHEFINTKTGDTLKGILIQNSYLATPYKADIHKHIVAKLPLAAIRPLDRTINEGKPLPGAEHAEAEPESAKPTTPPPTTPGSI